MQGSSVLVNGAEGEKVYQCEGLEYIEINPWKAMCVNCGYQVHKAVIRGHSYFHLKHLRDAENNSEGGLSLAENNEEEIELERINKHASIKQDLKQARIIRNSFGKLNHIAERTKYIRKLKAYRILCKNIW